MLVKLTVPVGLFGPVEDVSVTVTVHGLTVDTFVIVFHSSATTLGTITTGADGVGTGTFTVPSDFASMQGFTLDSRGQILVSGYTSSNKEMLTAIGVLQLVLHHQLIEPGLRLG